MLVISYELLHTVDGTDPKTKVNDKNPREIQFDFFCATDVSDHVKAPFDISIW